LLELPESSGLLDLPEHRLDDLLSVIGIGNDGRRS
jgi:hypothetical protein